MKRTLLGVFIAGTMIQFYPRLDRKNPPVTGEIGAPAEVREILRNSCYDCHSNETRWPWYSRVAPMSWLVTYDVRQARSRMNFSTWTQDLPRDYEQFLLERLVERVEKGEMPPRRYLLLHPNARVPSDALKVLRRWREQRIGRDLHTSS